ncbi:hypothetical protein BOTBODRAFT_31165 [Botryobasidium botryosum FD-172 SS1]|uniref:Major facilitator superfamily (MFS) profile domain-containing protein n=1 Tax=Botryobasidium botryosum (strain FD-172 SS1) TaxID=930990 RepID=A0A067MKK7_BOTB1|nr:hypothetical protein BOTBODRAFT_31165 [Botryobasidium botryosum FD-172 SS1]
MDRPTTFSMAFVSQSSAEAPTTVRGGLEDYENDGKPPFALNIAEAKLLGIAGVGFFLDAYDLFIINQVTTMLQYRYFGGQSLPAGLEGFVKAGANIGSVIGQFLFGYLASSLGRKAVYGKELMLIIFATIITISVPAYLGGNHVLVWIGVMRIILGIGVGGDYPMSASITGDRATLRKRGTLLAYIFSFQGWGSFVGSLVTMAVLGAFKHVMDDKGETYKVDAVWRIVVGLSLVPAFGTLYQRLTLPESKRFIESQKAHEASTLSLEKDIEKVNSGSISEDEPKAEVVAPVVKKAHWREFIQYYSEWRHGKILIATAGCWFLLDIAFYGINLNQSVVLQQIGFDGKTGTAWNKMFKIATGNLIITALGFVPGYYVTVLTIEYLGRKWIQIQGFLMAALFLGILAGKFHTLGTVPFVVCFALLQFFFNFGANSTTYIYPAEVFPTRFRASAHGISAASGKAGAIISSLAFNSLTKKIGTPAVLWIFFGCCLAGAALTTLLPEVKRRDPDAIEEEERHEARHIS